MVIITRFSLVLLFIVVNVKSELYLSSVRHDVEIVTKLHLCHVKCKTLIIIGEDAFFSIFSLVYLLVPIILRWNFNSPLQL